MCLDPGHRSTSFSAFYPIPRGARRPTARSWVPPAVPKNIRTPVQAKTGRGGRGGRKLVPMPGLAGRIVAGKRRPPKRAALFVW